MPRSMPNVGASTAMIGSLGATRRGPPGALPETGPRTSAAWRPLNSDWSPLRKRVGDTLTFHGQLHTKHRHEWRNIGCVGNANKYDIIGFIDFKLTTVLDQQPGRTVGGPR